jgi:hypothetical protein
MNRFKNPFLFFAILLTLTFFFGPSLVQAQEANPYPEEAWSLQDIVNLVGTLRDFVLIVGMLLVVIFLIWSGVTFLQAQGNPEKIQLAKQRFVWTLIGAAVILGTYAILATIRGFIGKGWL